MRSIIIVLRLEDFQEKLIKSLYCFSRFIKFFISFEYESVINDERSVILDMSDSNGQTWTNLGFYKQVSYYIPKMDI